MNYYDIIDWDDELEASIHPKTLRFFRTQFHELDRDKEARSAER